MKKNTLLLLLSVLFISCSPHTIVINSWRDKEKLKDKHIESIFIAVLTPHLDVQTTIENEIAYQVNQFGIKAYKSHNLFTKNFTKEEMPSQEELLRVLEVTNAKIFFTIRILDQKTSTSETTNTMFLPVYYNHGGIVDTFWYPSFKSPVNWSYTGLHEKNKSYYMETNLYDIETHELLWRATTKTFNPYDLEGLTKRYTEKILKKLERNKVIKKAEL